MLLIKARVRKSPIHGLGLFADQDIPKGTMIWKFQPGFDVEIPEDCLPSLSTAAQEQVLHYACYEADKRRFILSSDDDRFSNHADFPNTVQNGDVMYASQDIACGEEITCSYHEVIMLNFRPQEEAQSQEQS